MKRLLISAIAGVLLVSGFQGTALAQEQQNLAIVYKLLQERQALITRTDQTIEPSDQGSLLHSGDMLSTSSTSRAAIRFTDDGSIVRMGVGVDLEIRAEGERGALRKTLQINFGELWAKVNKRENAEYRIETPTAVAAVKGTEFYVRVDQDGSTTIITIDGVLDFFSNVGTVEIPAGSTGTITAADAAPAVAATSNEELQAFGDLAGEDATQPEAEDLVEIVILLQDASGNQKTMTIQMPRSEAARYLPPALD
jgi:hypothetical protein